MELTTTYTQYAREDIARIYETLLKSENAKYISLLHKHKKVLIKPDGSIMLDVNNMMPFILYTGEYISFFEACVRGIVSQFPNWHGTNNLDSIAAKFDSLSDSLSDSMNGMGVNAANYRNRPRVYENLSSLGNECGVSLSEKVQSLTSKERFAMIFADLVIGTEEIGDFAEYEDVVVACKRVTTKPFADEIFGFGKSVYQLLEKQLTPLLSGTIMNERKQRGECPYCGGTFKGLFKSKCSSCNTPKEQ